MRRIIGYGLALAFALAMGGCSTQAQNFARNLSAADCNSTETIQQFVNNLPPDPFVTGAQRVAIFTQLCIGLYGPVAAPPTAPGNQPVFAPAPAAGSAPAAK